MEEREADDACIRYWAALAPQPQPQPQPIGSGGLDGSEAMRLTALELGAAAQSALLPHAATFLRLRRLP